jgi:hypothetical protein
MDENHVEYYGAYYLGALLAVKKVIDDFIKYPWKGEEKLYRDVALELITRDKRSMQLYMDEFYEMRFRNHQRNAKGKLISCEAYFADKRVMYEEVK